MPLFIPSAANAAATKDDRQTQQKAKVIPAAVVIGFVDADVILEQGNDKGKWGDESMPHSQPKTSHFSFSIGKIDHFIGASRTG